MNKGRRKQSREQWAQAVRDQIVQVGDCEEWQGKMKRTFPIVSVPAGFVEPDRPQRYVSVRAWLWEQLEGARPAEGLRIRMKCRNDRCCKREHMVLMDAKQFIRESVRRNVFRTSKAVVAHTRGARQRSKNLTLELAREIRNSDETAVAWSRRLGVTAECVRQIRRGETWKETAANSSVFSWRPAA